jgi:hypothetical protein
MGVKKVDALQTAQILALQADVADLRTKLNLLVADTNDISIKFNILRGDLNSMNNRITEGYTAPSSPVSHGILESLDRFKDLLEDHLYTQTYRYNIVHNGWAVHGPGTVAGYWPPNFAPGPGGGGNAGSSGGAASHGAPVLGGTNQGGNTAHSADAANANVVGLYNNQERLLSIEPDKIARAKKLVRNTLKKLRKT